MAATNPTQEKWDVHTHTTPAPETFDALARFSHYEKFVRVRAQVSGRCHATIIDHRGHAIRHLHRNAWHPPTRIAECDTHRVTMQVLSPTPMMIPDSVDSESDAAEICRIVNDGNAAIVAQHPTRFTALAALPMRFADAAIRELERVRALGMRGIEINSNIAGRDLDDPAFFPIFQAAAELDMAVFIHPWGGFMSPAEESLRARMHPARNWRPWLIGMGMETALAFDAMRCGAVHERLPHLRVLYAHGGGAFPAVLGRLEHGAYSRPDLFCNSPRLNPFQTVRECAVYTDSLTHDPWLLHLLLQHLGARRVAMGSDYPYPLGELEPFDRETHVDAHGNQRPYSQAKNIHPGHMIEHLPETEAEIDAAWQHFHWLPRSNADGARTLPLLTPAQKRQILSGTARGLAAMELRLGLSGRDYAVDSAAAVDISLPVRFDSLDDGPFGAPPARVQPLRSGEFVGSVALGGSCNCGVHTFCAHTSGTHTECVGHILQQPVHICDVMKNMRTSLMPATLISVHPQLVSRNALGNGEIFDLVITRHDIGAALATEDLAFIQAVLVRTRHDHGKPRYSAATPYFAGQAVWYLVEMGVQHLLTDLPSLDRMDDAELTSHRIFWQAGSRGKENAEAAKCARTVTEMIRVEDSVADGPYLLDLQVAAFAADAAPSRPLLYPVRAL